MLVSASSCPRYTEFVLKSFSELENQEMYCKGLVRGFIEGLR
jgi:hypothetical protein